MTLAQKAFLILAGLGAGFMVFTNPKGVFTAAQALRSLGAGSIVDVTTGGKGQPPARP